MTFSLPVKTFLKQLICSHPKDQFLNTVREQLKLAWQRAAACDLSEWKERKSETSTNFQNHLCCLTVQHFYVQAFGFFCKYLFWAHVVEITKLKAAVAGKEPAVCTEPADCKSEKQQIFIKRSLHVWGGLISVPLGTGVGRWITWLLACSCHLEVWGILTVASLPGHSRAAPSSALCCWWRSDLSNRRTVIVAVPLSTW